MVGKENFYSYHVFFFPFKWDPHPDDLGINNEHENMKSFSDALAKHSSIWARSKDSYFPPKYLPQYNEVAYFYDFVRPVIYDDGREDSFLYHYSIKDYDQLYYTIELFNGKKYTLDLDDIVLHVYEAGIGVLSFHMYNKRIEQSHPDDILAINQYGRRLYPPFYDTDFLKLGSREYDTDSDWESGLKKTKSKELAENLFIGNEIVTIAEDDFSTYTQPDRTPSLIKQLLSPCVIDEMHVKPVGDDRMFVLCWNGDQQLTNTIKQHDDQDNYTYLSDDWWYKFVFVDAGLKTCQNPEMTKSLLKTHTNARWIEYGTLFGVSRYSFVALTSPLTSFALVASHMRTMYYKMVEHCIVQRVCLLKFSEEVSTISRLETNRGLAKRVSHLYRRYIHFVNRVHFREITAQEQGIELYDKLMEHMRIYRDVTKLDKEIQELHEYATLQEEEARTAALSKLTMLTVLFIVPAFIVGYYGMNLFESTNTSFLNNLLFFFGLIFAASTLILALKSNYLGMKQILFLTLFFIVIFFMLIILPQIFFHK